MRQKLDAAAGTGRHSRRRHRTAKTIAMTGVNILALASLARRIGPKRVVRLAALATEGYLGEVGRHGPHRTGRAKG
jgi:hypothetical protein